MRPNTPDSLALVGFIAVGVLYGGGKPNAPSPPNLVNPVNPVQNNIPVRTTPVQQTFAERRAANWNVSRSVAQLLGSWNDAAASMSWNAGVDVAHGTNLAYAVGNFVTNTWNAFDVKERTLWPNLSEADNHAIRNTWTNFNYQFISPGFIERGRTP